MDKAKIKALLPNGSYKKIAEALGLSEGTVSMFFSAAEVRMADDTAASILREAEAIVEVQSLSGIEAVHGESKAQEVRGLLAA